MFCVVLGCGRFALGRRTGSRLSFGEPYAVPPVLPTCSSTSPWRAFGTWSARFTAPREPEAPTRAPHQASPSCIRKPRPARSARSTDASRRPPRSTSGEPEPGRRSTDASRAPHQAAQGAFCRRFTAPRPVRATRRMHRPLILARTCLACPGAVSLARLAGLRQYRIVPSCDPSTLIVILE